MIRDECAGGLVFLNNKLVALQRFNGVWLFPKGHIDPGENAEMAALREVKEESGLTARIIEKLGQTSYRFYQDNKEHFKTVEWFVMEALTDKIVLEPGFFQDYRFLDEPELHILSFEHDRAMSHNAFEIYRKWREQP